MDIEKAKASIAKERERKKAWRKKRKEAAKSNEADNDVESTPISSASLELMEKALKRK